MLLIASLYLGEMRLARAIILQNPVPKSLRLKALIDQCLTDGVALIAICGRDAFALEAEVDWKIIGDGPLPRGLFFTSAHIADDDQGGLSDESHWPVHFQQAMVSTTSC
ncbi:hypothetical protein KX729_27300 [Rhizobium sp. XQZ8]|uniref:hypothetical protein n=1 Tax=Rhizobium populisoli TaxID=2859785 RepID=UPI001CA50518|nr:hypothetical protein [Rhizobium populisoli]MBW6425156.1 hypothetical protein [Rhizobium populisoli]